MAKRIRFTSPDATYRSGDIAHFEDHNDADRFIARGTAVPHTGDGDAADDQAAVDIASQSQGPVNVQGRVEAHDIPLSTSIVHTTEANDPDQGDKDKGPVDKGTPASQAEKAKADGK